MEIHKQQFLNGKHGLLFESVNDRIKQIGKTEALTT